MIRFFFKIFALLLVLNLTTIAGVAQEQAVISDYLEKTTAGKVTIDQPDGLRSRLKPKPALPADAAAEEDVKVVGYRIQVFSDNNQRTAKSQAQVREQNIAGRFPELKVYRIYKSPQWRVRVGDFRTRAEAEQMMHEIKEAFPYYANEVTVVVDNINLHEK